MFPSKQVFAPNVEFVMGNGEPVPYDPLTFYHGALAGQLVSVYMLSHAFT